MWNDNYAQEINNNVTGIDAYQGYLYVYGLFDGTLKKINLETGAIQTLPVDFIANTHGLEVTNDAIWITDNKTHLVYKLDLNGRVLATFGEKNVPGWDATHFNMPTDVAVAPNGNIYITDGYGNRRVVCLNPQGKFLFDWGTQGSGPGEFMNPHDIVIVDSKIYVADRENNRVQIFDMEGKYLNQWPAPGKVFGICYENDRMYMTIQAEDSDYILITDMNGRVLEKIGRRGKGPGEFDVPHSIALDERYMYIAEVANKRIQRLDRVNK